MSPTTQTHDATGRPVAPTARGDKAQRHRDVLVAAAAVLDELGWEDFSIREVASRAGVSPGAVYQWFSGKGEIWARLQTARFERDIEEIEGWATDLGPAELVRRAVAVIAENHREIGRHRFDFVRTLTDEFPDYAYALTSAHRALNTTLTMKLSPIMPIGLDETERRARMSWLWAVGKGVGDHLVDARHEAHGVDRETFLATTTACAMAGLTAA